MARSIFEGRVTAGPGRGTASEHYRRFAKAGVPGFILDEDYKPEDALPDEFAHLVVWYSDLRSRQSRGQYFEPLGLLEIEAYERRLSRLDITMDPIDFELLCHLDGIWMDVNRPPDTETINRGKKATRH